MPSAFQSFIFALLVVQNATVVLLMRHTRSDAAQSAYLPSVAVLTIECTKMLICTAKVGLFGGARGGSGAGAKGNQAAVVSSTAAQQVQGESLSSLLNVRQFGASAVPALLYLVQNNLIFFAMGRVDAPTFQVLYQSKVVLTAVLSVLLLGRRLRTRQWLALALLTAGIVAVQRANEHSGGKAKGGGGGARRRLCGSGGGQPRVPRGCRVLLARGRVLREDSEGPGAVHVGAQLAALLRLRRARLRRPRRVA